MEQVGCKRQINVKNMRIVVLCVLVVVVHCCWFLKVFCEVMFCISATSHLLKKEDVLPVTYATSFEHISLCVYVH